MSYVVTGYWDYGYTDNDGAYDPIYVLTGYWDVGYTDTDSTGGSASASAYNYVITNYWLSGYVDTDSYGIIASAVQGFAPGTLIELFQLQLNVVQHGVDATYYFHAGLSELNTNIIWAGQPYTALPIEAEGFEYNGQGSLPRPRLRVSNILGTITSLILTLPNGLDGAKVTRIRTLSRFLDAANFTSGVNATADPLAEFPREIYYIDRKSAENRNLVEFELASAFDLAGVRAPKRQCITRCQWKYRSVECGYTGTNYFDVNDVPIPNSLNDACGKRLNSCQLRFGSNAELPFGGYPGVGTYFA
jgi:lambda family phage minor tail protein L